MTDHEKTLDCQINIHTATIGGTEQPSCVCGKVLDRTGYRHTVPLARCARCRGVDPEEIRQACANALKGHIAAPNLTRPEKTRRQKLIADVIALRDLTGNDETYRHLLTCAYHGQRHPDELSAAAAAANLTRPHGLAAVEKTPNRTGDH